mmetsp:Transcript_28353/g.51180  ORF Transcript_28353/g.51180 Transcript_28353/m.51180 type:complete len:352 (-) Transcript_28353:103-1158(-)
MANQQRAAGLSSGGIREPSRGRGRSASPPVPTVKTVLPQGAAISESQTCRKQFPGATNERAKDVATRTGVARDRGLLDRPVASPVLNSHSSAPSVVAPWLSKEHTSPTASKPQSRRSAGVDRSEQKSQKVEAQQAFQLFGVPPLEVYGQKGIGENAPPPQPVSALPNEASSNGLRSYRSLPPELFRYEDSARMSSVHLSQRSWDEHKVGAAGLSSYRQDVQSLVIPEERPTQSYAPSVQSLPSRAPQRVTTARKSYHDLRSELRDGLSICQAAPVTRQTLPARRPVFRPPLRKEMQLEISPGLSQPVKRVSHDPHSAPTSAGVSHHTSRASFGSTTSLVEAVALGPEAAPR